jgi:hypothetical protein
MTLRSLPWRKHASIRRRSRRGKKPAGAIVPGKADPLVGLVVHCLAGLLTRFSSGGGSWRIWRHRHLEGVHAIPATPKGEDGF